MVLGLGGACVDVYIGREGERERERVESAAHGFMHGEEEDKRGDV